MDTAIGRVQQLISRLVHSISGALVLGATLYALCSAAAAHTGEAAALHEPCAGDCNLNGSVTVDEIVTMISIALGDSFAMCPSGGNSDGTIKVDNIITAISGALNGCATTATPTCTLIARTIAPTSIATPTPTKTFTPGSVCGDGRWQNEPEEQCDDGNTDPFDGCDAHCRVESGFHCVNEPSECYLVEGCVAFATCSVTPAPSPTATPSPVCNAVHPPATHADQMGAPTST